MFINKSELIRIINNMPDEIDTEELMHLIHLIDKVYSGIEDIENNSLIPHSQMQKEADKWIEI